MDTSIDEIKDILMNSKNISVVGLSPKEDRPSYIVASYLQAKGFRIIPVRPPGSDILGEKVYSSLLEIPFDIDVVDIFRKPEVRLTDQLHSTEQIILRPCPAIMLTLHYGWSQTEWDLCCKD